MASPAALGAAEKKALDELRRKLEEAIATNQLLTTRPHPEKTRARVNRVANFDDEPYEEIDQQEISLWGVPLLPSKGHIGTNVLLLKFLRARDFKPSDALEMIRKTLWWRKEFGVEKNYDKEVIITGLPDMKEAVYMNGTDRDGHPVCYNTYYRVFRQRDLYRMAFASEERRERFMRWRVQLMEMGIKQLSFEPDGIGSMVQVIDLKDSMNSSTREIRAVAKKLALIFQDNYPEFVAKTIFLNVSYRYYAYHALFSNLFTQRTKSKFIFARPCKVTETLLKFIAPENIPIQYGGLQRENDDEFSAKNGEVTEQVLKPSCCITIEIPIVEPGVTVVWDFAVVGWDVHYKEEFIPDDEGSYTVLIQEEKKLEETVRNSFYIYESGKIVLTIDNRTYKKKRMFYRSRSKPTVPLYNLLSSPSYLL